MQPPGRMIPARPPRPAKRSAALVGVAATLLLACVGLLVWAWQEEDSARARLARSIPVGYGNQIPVHVAPESFAAARTSPSAPPPTASLRAVSPMELTEPGASTGAAPREAAVESFPTARSESRAIAHEPQETPASIAFEEEPGQFATAAGAATLDPELLIARGDDYLARSDVVSARLFYQRAAEGGSGAAAAAMAKTYDPIILDRRAIRGASPDPLAALDWYRKAAELGDASANAGTEGLLRRLQSEAANGDARARGVLDRALR